MKFLRLSSLLLVVVLLLSVVLIRRTTSTSHSNEISTVAKASATAIWQAPDEKTIPPTHAGDLIRYGRELIVNTAFYLGPNGRIAHLSNGMNCQNCHLNAGTKNDGNPFSAVASTYPKYRPRSGRVETIPFRINDCLMRSLNGSELDSDSREMQAMVAYIEWVGSGVPKGAKPAGSGLEPLPYLVRAADTAKGRLVYVQKCESCHGSNGEGQLAPDSGSFVFPPLWGKNSYNVGAGLYRLFQFASFIKHNMPLGAATSASGLSNEEAWDVAAFVNSRPRPQKRFPSDWPDLTKKPIDYPFGPYVDSFSEVQHKYGPFAPMAKIDRR